MSDLDPRGLEVALHAVEGRGLTPDGGTPHGWRCEYPDRYPDYCKCPIEVAELAVSAYLAVTQPIVTTVEELEGLSRETVIQTVDEGVPEVWITDGAGGQEWSLAGSCQRFSAALIPLPARVIWTPHESA